MVIRFNVGDVETTIVNTENGKSFSLNNAELIRIIGENEKLVEEVVETLQKHIFEVLR